MISGIGVDIVEIHRIEKAVNRTKSFLEKTFSEEELEFFKNKKLRIEQIAGRFAAKEAISKALGTGFRGFSFRDLTIINDELGKPIVILSENAKKIVGKDGNYKIHISISHSNDNAIAYAILEVE
ncbi:holo-ACP synthase [Clostridium ihumii]|uniref:holo-ACP synthase n=1 Tax=Clostridium ihumii TaxID=1470356 RepID=UPI00058D13E3|nr:holo-ACP synthase [Clostridium ihumii]